MYTRTNDLIKKIQVRNLNFKLIYMYEYIKSLKIN